MGWKMRVRIKDAAGKHHTPNRHYTLAGARRTEDGELRLYFNELQFLAVPLFGGDNTRLESTPQGGRFISHDRERGLIYDVEFYA